MRHYQCTIHNWRRYTDRLPMNFRLNIYALFFALQLIEALYLRKEENRGGRNDL